MNQLHARAQEALSGVRRKPGRPRKPLPGPDPGHSPGTGSVQRLEKSEAVKGTLVQTTVAPISPRLLDLDSTAVYLGVSGWTVRDLEGAGILARVRIPLPNDGELRKLLFDRADLDRLIEAWKESR